MMVILGIDRSRIGFTSILSKINSGFSLSLSNEWEEGEYSKTYEPGWVEDFFGMMNWKANNFKIAVIKSM